MTRTFVRLGALLGFALSLSTAALAADTKYQVAKQFALSGEGGWDYLTYDAAGKRLFITRSTHVMVVDPATGSILGDIPALAGVHGVALAPELGKGFTSNGRDNSVTVFDLKTLATLANIPIDGKNPDAIVYDPTTKRVFTFNGGSANATAIDAATNAVIGTFALPGRPEFAAVGANGTIYVNLEDKSSISAIDAKTNTVVRTTPLAPCEEPSGLSIDVAHHRLFAGCSNSLMAVIDGDTGKVVTTLPIGKGTDATAFDPGTQLAFSSNGEGTLTIVHEDSPNAYTVVQNATTQASARTMAIDTNTHAAYTVVAQYTLGPPAAGSTRPTRTLVPGSFMLLVVR